MSVGKKNTKNFGGKRKIYNWKTLKKPFFTKNQKNGGTLKAGGKKKKPPLKIFPCEATKKGGILPKTTNFNLFDFLGKNKFFFFKKFWIIGVGVF